jgi:hypothetical protein
MGGGKNQVHLVIIKKSVIVFMPIINDIWLDLEPEPEPEPELKLALPILPCFLAYWLNK